MRHNLTYKITYGSAKEKKEDFKGHQTIIFGEEGNKEKYKMCIKEMILDSGSKRSLNCHYRRKGVLSSLYEANLLFINHVIDQAVERHYM